MKINNLRLATPVPFNNIDNGTVFQITSYGEYYMKIECGKDSHGVTCTAVMLKCGTMILINDDMLVYPVDCELTIK